MKNLKQLRRRDDEDEDYEAEESEESPFAPFLDNGWISEVEETLKSGKEATVYRCRAHPATGQEFFALKLYRDRQNRNFKNDSMYQEGRVILNGHTRRAVQKKTAFGRIAQAGMWTNYENEHLSLLHRVGADVPKVYKQYGNALLMEYVGDGEEAAPVLNSVELPQSEARPLFEVMLTNIELWLKHNLVHADLSPYNILYWEGRLKIIDFPQAVDPRFNSHAASLLQRDIENVCRYFNRYGLQADATRISGRLWQRFTRSQL